MAWEQFVKVELNILFCNVKVKQTNNKILKAALRRIQGKLIEKSNLFSWFKVS